MNTNQELTALRAVTAVSGPVGAPAPRLFGMLPALGGGAKDSVTLTVPALRSKWEKEQSREAFLVDPKQAGNRKALLASLKAVLDIDARARKEGTTIRQAAAAVHDDSTRTLETAWVSLLEQNREMEKAVRSCALFFANLKSSRERLHGKIFIIDARADEIASDKGQALLARELEEYSHRPDPRASRGYLLVPGWVGSESNLHRLAEMCDEHRAILVTDAPDFLNMDELREESKPGQTLDNLRDNRPPARRAIVLGDSGRVRPRIVGRTCEEKEDVFVPLSAPWFGMYLNNIEKGIMWDLAVGYANPVVGIDATRLDLLISSSPDHPRGHGLLLKHRVNPAVRLSSTSRKVVIWGPHTLCSADGGVQMGVSVVEMFLLRHTEWLINKCAMFQDIEKARTQIEKILTKYLGTNMGPDRMFLVGSGVEVHVEDRKLVVDYRLRFREVIERAQIRLLKLHLEQERGFPRASKVDVASPVE